MAASENDYFKKVGPATVTTLSAPGKATSATSITVGSTTNFPTDTGIIIAIRVVDTAGELVAGTYTEWSATVTSGTSIAINATPVYGSDQVYAAGSTTQVFVPISSYAFDKLVDGILVQHKQTGAHSAVTADSLSVSGTSTLTGNVTIGGSLTIGSVGSGGWDPISGTITAVTANGNRSYDLTTDTDNTTLVSPGMRLRTSRTVAAPTQCTSLNGTTQYYSKASPNKLTFTDDFVVSAWVKLSSYAAGSIVSRYNGTSGWELRVDATGQIVLSGYNAAAGNYRNVTTYQSIPLNKWVHIAAQLDMSAHTATPTTSYVMLDGADVPCSVVQAGTNPTALIQAGDFCIGSRSGGSVFFPGKIAQAAVFNAKVTQATMRGYISQGLAGTETSLASAYSFNNAITDLNTTTPNDLTANGSAVATNADSPFGGQAGGTISSTLDYGIVAKVTASTITVNVAEGCTIPTSGGVASASYSTYKSPFGFPGQAAKWRVEYHQIARTSVAMASTATWYNANDRVTLPLGSWMAGYNGSHQLTAAAVGFLFTYITLSTANNSESDKRFTVRTATVSASTSETDGNVAARASIDTTAATDYYLNGKPGAANATIYFGDTVAPFTIYAENAYV